MQSNCDVWAAHSTYSHFLAAAGHYSAASGVEPADAIVDAGYAGYHFAPAVAVVVVATDGRHDAAVRTEFAGIRVLHGHHYLSPVVAAGASRDDTGSTEGLGQVAAVARSEPPTSGAGSVGGRHDRYDDGEAAAAAGLVGLWVDQSAVANDGTQDAGLSASPSMQWATLLWTGASVSHKAASNTASKNELLRMRC